MKTVFVVGAGPAGLYASNKFAQAGYQIILFNRDIKPGGLAEYGIYPVKEKMKSGLRKQFGKILSQPNLHYLGHAAIGGGSGASLELLRELAPSAVVCAVGAQGTKRMGIAGEESRGVYSAKDFVYHYNLLPPFASQDFSTGKRVAIVGMGNVMVDIARWLLVDDPAHAAEEVIVVARRGPFEAKFDHKEFEHIEMFLDRKAFDDELARVKENLASVGQDVSRLSEATFPNLARPARETPGARLRFAFLTSPKAIRAGADGRIDRLTLTENTLVAREEGGTSARATDRTCDLDVDTMIFAIGDVVDDGFGLPSAHGGYVTNPDGSDPKRAPYEVFDPQAGRVMAGHYVVGWARKASEGLVGVARFDAEQGAAHVLKYLESAPEKTPLDVREVQRELEARGPLTLVSKDDLACLARAEEREARERGLPSFKFADDETMLARIGEEKSAPKPTLSS